MDSTAAESAPDMAVPSLTQKTATASSRREETLKAWKQNVQRWYPKLQQRAYFVPPVHMKRINYHTETVGADTVAVAQPPVKAKAKGTGHISESDVQDDQAQQLILHCLYKFFQQNSQVVFVLSQLSFTAYLGEACFAAAAREFPRPVDRRAQNQDRGDFDLLFIHRQYGLVASEVKSIGAMFSGEVADQPGEDKALVKRLQQVVRQLNKSRDILQYVTGDLPQPPRVTTSLMLPYITTDRLRRVLAASPPDRQALSQCLGRPSHEDPAQLCLTSERLSDKERFWHVTDDVMQALTQWWQTLMEGRGEDTSMTEAVFEDLIARFAGPATTVEVFCPSALPRATRVVRTEGEAVSETAERYTDLVLSPQQIHILSSKEKLVYLTGPPGTGKTVVLMLKAGQWLTEGHDVHVVSLYRESIAASCYIYKALSQKHSSGQGGQVYLNRKGEEFFREAVSEIRSSHSDVYLIAHEVDARCFKQFYQDMRGRTKSLHMWTARIFTNLMPEDFTVFTLNMPLRSPACVTREVQASIHGQFHDQMLPYDENPYPQTDGPCARELRHQGSGHEDDVRPDECETCGVQLAAVLSELHVGESDATTSPNGSPRALRYEDVFVLTMSEFRDSSTDQAGEGLPASGVVRGLRQAGVPVRVFTNYRGTCDDKYFEAFEEVATMTGPDAVVAAHVRAMAGLERKVVVWIQTEKGDSLPEIWGRAFGYSRSSAQLIIISWPNNSSTPQTEPDMLARPGEAEGATASADSADPSPQQLQVSDDKQVIEELFRIFEDNITEEDVRDINTVVQMDVTYNDGADVDTFFLNLKHDGDRMVRGAWPGEQPQTAARVQLAATCFQRALMEGGTALAEMLKHKCCFAQVALFGETLRMLSFFQRVQPLLKAAVLRMRRETSVGNQQ